MFYYFLVELLKLYDITKFDGHWSSNKEITQGGGICPPPPPAVPDSKKPGLFRAGFRVNITKAYKLDDAAGLL